MRIMKKILVVFLVSTLCIGLGFLGYSKYKEKQALSFAMADVNECESLEGFEYSYQICESTDSTFARKVDIDNENQIIVYIYDNTNQEKRYGVEIMWNEECVPSTVVMTDLEFSDGTSKTLECKETAWGTVLSHGYSQPMPIREVNFDYGGFRVNEIFYADLETLEREYSLNKSRTVEEIEEAKRLADQQLKEEERLANELRLEEERIENERLRELERLREIARAEAVENARKRLACKEEEDAREKNYLRRYDEARSKVILSNSCDFGTILNEYSQCVPSFVVTNDSEFTVRSLVIGYGNTDGFCPDIISKHSTYVNTAINPGQALRHNAGYTLWYGEGERVCAQVNDVELMERRKYDRNSCDAP